MTKYGSVEQLIEVKISTIVLMLNQNGITELIQIANDIQGRVDAVMNAGEKPKAIQADRIADAAAPTSFLEAAKEKLPMILEEGDESSAAVAPSEWWLCS